MATSFGTRNANQQLIELLSFCLLGLSVDNCSTSPDANMMG